MKRPAVLSIALTFHVSDAEEARDVGALFATVARDVAEHGRIPGECIVTIAPAGPPPPPPNMRAPAGVN